MCYVCIIYLSIYLSISLSLYIYIYIYTYVCIYVYTHTPISRSPQATAGPESSFIEFERRKQDRRWNRDSRPQPPKFDKLVFLFVQLILRLSKLVIWGSSWGRGFRFHWLQEVPVSSSAGRKRSSTLIIMILLLLLLLLLLLIIITIVKLIMIMIIRGAARPSTASGVRTLCSAPGQGQMWVSTNGVTVDFIFFYGGTFWVLLLTQFCFPKSARTYYFFIKICKTYTLCLPPLFATSILYNAS